MTETRIARTAGVLFLLTFVTSIPALALFQPVLDDPVGYVGGGGADTRVLLGAVLELLLVVANIGTAIVLFPILRRQNEALALGFVAARIVESALIAVGLLAVLTIVTLGDGTAGADAGTIAYALAALKDWTFLLGPGFVVGIGNGMLLGVLMYRSGLVPPRLALFGVVGGPLICASGIAVLVGVAEAGGTLQAVATIPEFIWELGLGLYLTVRGFRPSPLVARHAADAPRVAGVAVAG